MFTEPRKTDLREFVSNKLLTLSNPNSRIKGRKVVLVGKEYVLHSGEIDAFFDERPYREGFITASSMFELFDNVVEPPFVLSRYRCNDRMGGGDAPFDSPVDRVARRCSVDANYLNRSSGKGALSEVVRYP